MDRVRICIFLYVQGLEGFLSAKDTLRKRQRIFKPEDRLFSLSSVTSPAVRAVPAACYGRPS